MRHGIPFFDNTTGSGWGSFWAGSGLANLLFTAAVFGYTPLHWSLVLLTVLPWAFVNYGIFGHYFSTLNVSQIDRWKEYQRLPEERRRQIGLTRKEFAKMTDVQRGEVASKVNDIHQIIVNRNKGMMMSAELRTRFDAVLEDEKSAYTHEKAVRAQMKELGWDE